MPGPELPKRLEIKAAGSELSDQVMDALVDVRITKSLGIPAYARLVFRTETTGSGVDAARFTAKMGQEIKVSVVEDTLTWAAFEGLIVSQGIELDSGTSQYLIYECYDHLYRLGRETTTASFANQTVSDAVKKIVSEAGLSVGSMPATPTEHEGMYQFDTAYAHLDRLVRDMGWEWYVEGKKVYLRARPESASSKTLTVGENLRSFQARYSPVDHADEVTVTGWDAKQKKPIIGKATFAPGRTKTKTKLTGVKPHADVAGKKSFAIPRAVKDADEAKRFAEALVERRSSEMVRARGEAEVTDLQPGSTVKINGLVEDWVGDYYCTTVEHTMGSSGSMRTFFEVGPTVPDSLVDIFDGAADTTLHRVVSSLTVGIVTNNNDEQGGLNRVKVKLPYFADDKETNWARVLQIGAGGDRGWVTLPEVGDEVLVGFEHGQLDRPFVLGGLHNGKDKAKHALTDLVKDGAVQSRVFNSRLGHQLQFMDGSADTEQFVHIKTAKAKAILHVGEDKIELEATDIPVKVFNKEGTFEITDTGDITISGKSITLKATQNVTIEAGQNLKATADVNLDMSASGSFKAKANASATLEASGQTVVKGGMVQIN